METLKKQLPNASAVLVLGILSLVLNCLLIGFILGIIGLILSREGKALYAQNPDLYDGYGSLNAGRILCIISVCLGGAGLLMTLFWFSFVASIVSGVLSNIPL